MGSYNVMNGGDGLHSYAKNSAYQGSSIHVMKSMIEDVISSKLEVNELPLNNSNCFSIADFGCSTGHNSFRTIKIIIDAVEKKFQTKGLSTTIPEFQVFFNDQAGNDFNMLFNSFPPERKYFAVGVPGSFLGRVLPKASLQFVHSSWSLHWLSEVPKAVADSNSVAWNKGRIYCEGAQKEVLEAYSKQYAKDITKFLEARAEELVEGGLMTLIVPAIPSFWNRETGHVLSSSISLLGSCLVDMVNEGEVSEVKVDSFNIPVYFPEPQELNSILKNNQNFTIERTEILNNKPVSLNNEFVTPNAMATGLRAALEGTLRQEFDIAVIGELFARFEKKLASLPNFQAEHDRTIIILSVLKRNKE